MALLSGYLGYSKIIVMENCTIHYNLHTTEILGNPLENALTTHQYNVAELLVPIVHLHVHTCTCAGFISGFHSRGGKYIAANFRGGGNSIQNIGKANCQGGVAKAPLK